MIDFTGDPRGFELQLILQRAKYERWLMGETDAILTDAFTRIGDALTGAGVTSLSDVERSRLLRLYDEIGGMLDDAYGSVSDTLTSEMQRYAVLESDIVKARLEAAVSTGMLPSSLTLTLDGLLSRNYVDSIAALPIRGLAIGDWFERQAQTMTFEAKRTIQQGFLDGLTPKEIARQIVPASTSTEPALQLRALRGARSVVRTTQTAVSNDAAMTSYQAAGDDVTDRYRWSSVRDSRTTPICRSLDGKVFRYDDKDAPLPPAHIGCRSTTKPILADAVAHALGMDPEQPAYQYQDYSAWLRTQSTSTQNSILGATRAEWWRNGRMTLEEAVNDDGRVLSLDELRDALDLGAPSLN